MKRMSWTKKEMDELERYFKTNITQMTLYQRIHKINPKRPYGTISRTLRKMAADGWTRSKDTALKNLRVGYLDIEATNLKANFGFILSWYIKEKGKNHFDSSYVTRKEILTYKFDKRVVSELMAAMKEYDVLYTHYGSDWRFDVPFIRTRAFVHGIEDELPQFMDNFIMDTYPIARSKLKLHSNRLGVIAETLGVKTEKTPVSAKQWQLAHVGNAKAMKYVLDHNKKDVIILEGVHKKLEKVERPIYRSI